MKNLQCFNRPLMWLAASMMTALLVACGGSDSQNPPPAPDLTPPGVTATLNADGAAGVAINTRIGAFFTEPMNPQTLNAQTFTVSDGSKPVPGTISYSGVALTFTPASLLQANTRYTMTLSSSATDVAGNKLSGNQAVFPAPGNYVWSFTTGNAPDNTLPYVTLSNPASNGTGVALNSGVAITFSEEMDPLKMTSANFTLTQGGNAVAGSVSYIKTSATFTPAAMLLANTEYTATISKNVTDLAGNALAGNQGILTPSDYVWRFTTGSAIDSTAPTVSLTNPLNGASNVGQNKSINATFDKIMAAASINSATFTLKQGQIPVAGSVSYAGNTASFVPSASLTAGAQYTATISKNVTDLAGNRLAGNQGNPPNDYVWSFIAAIIPPPLPGAGPDPVNLGSASNFAIIAGAGVTNTGATIINGDLGTSPTGTINGFPPGLVNGNIHAADPFAAQAKLDLTSAYIDAQGRSLNAIALPGDLGGLTLAPGLYVNASSTGISGSGKLTLDAQGDPTASWIFKTGSTLTTGTGSQIILAGGARAANITWSVGTSATLGVTSIFKGTILADQSISLATGAVTEGRMLTRIGAVTLQGNTVSLP